MSTLPAIQNNGVDACPVIANSEANTNIAVGQFDFDRGSPACWKALTSASLAILVTSLNTIGSKAEGTQHRETKAGCVFLREFLSVSGQRLRKLISI